LACELLKTALLGALCYISISSAWREQAFHGECRRIDIDHGEVPGMKALENTQRRPFYDDPVVLFGGLQY
jgi:hypothetical protein